MNTTQYNTDSVMDATTMSRQGSQGRRSNRLLRVAVAALLFTVASAFVTAQGASASSTATVSGSSDDVSGRTTYVYPGHGMPRVRF
jgi:hypothetical protein